MCAYVDHQTRNINMEAWTQKWNKFFPGVDHNRIQITTIPKTAPTSDSNNTSVAVVPEPPTLQYKLEDGTLIPEDIRVHLFHWDFDKKQLILHNEPLPFESEQLLQIPNKSKKQAISILFMDDGVPNFFDSLPFGLKRLPGEHRTSDGRYVLSATGKDGKEFAKVAVKGTAEVLYLETINKEGKTFQEIAEEIKAAKVSKKEEEVHPLIGTLTPELKAQLDKAEMTERLTTN